MAPVRMSLNILISWRSEKGMAASTDGRRRDHSDDANQGS